jgi:agmatine deiminase
VRIPMPPSSTGTYPPSGAYRTFTNSIIVNKTVIVPIYQLQYDTTGLRIYREAMPGYRVVGIDCNSTIGALGAIHCIAKEIGSREPVFISHAKVIGSIPEGLTTEIKAYIKTTSGVANAYVYWTTDTLAGFTCFTDDSCICRYFYCKHTFAYNRNKNILLCIRHFSER